mgnify:CR=1 FL=1
MTISCETNTSDELIVEAIEKEYGVKMEPVYYDGMSVQEVALGRCDLWPRAKTSCITTLEEVDNLKILGDTNVLETNVYPFSKTERGEELCSVRFRGYKRNARGRNTEKAVRKCLTWIFPCSRKAPRNYKRSG